jgi:hypothetical protein
MLNEATLIRMTEGHNLSTCGCGASFKTDEELEKHHKTEHEG